MTPLLLDTHILVWWRAEPDKLDGGHARLLEQRESRGVPSAISAITLWELAKMVERGRLSIDAPIDLWLAEIEEHPMLEVLPIDARVAAESVSLVAFHRDPADQIIVATARCRGMRLLTADERIRRWGRVSLA